MNKLKLAASLISMACYLSFVPFKAEANLVRWTLQDVSFWSYKRGGQGGHEIPTDTFDATGWFIENTLTEEITDWNITLTKPTFDRGVFGKGLCIDPFDNLRCDSATAQEFPPIAGSYLPGAKGFSFRSGRMCGHCDVAFSLVALTNFPLDRFPPEVIGDEPGGTVMLATGAYAACCSAATGDTQGFLRSGFLGGTIIPEPNTSLYFAVAAALALLGRIGSIQWPTCRNPLKFFQKLAGDNEVILLIMMSRMSG